MRIISLVVAFCFTFNVFAESGTLQELERLVDDYQYTLSVEWDQKDSQFYEDQSKVFFTNLQTLITEHHLDKLDIIELLEKKMNNEAAIEALKLKMSLLPKVNTSEELATVIKESAKDFYSQGASWNGQVVFSTVIGIIVIGALAYSIWWDANHKCVQRENRYVCNNLNNCTNYAGYDGYSTYYDSLYCGPTYYECGYANVCTKYAWK